MPAIQVAKTDTFETQRQKINTISNQIFNISAGGTDLTTGNLKLGDGSLSTPSLAFLNDSSTGVFRPDTETFGFVSAAKKIFQFNSTGTSFFRDIKIQKKTVGGVSIQSSGQNYDAGSYTGISHYGGSGAGATFNIVVSAYSGVTTAGSGYTYTGTGGGMGGGGAGQQYTNIPLSGGSGSGNISTLTFSNGGFSATTVTTYGTGYAINDILVLPSSKNNITIGVTNNSGNITVSSTSGYFVGMILTKVSGTPSLTTPNDPQTGLPQTLVVNNIVDSTTIATNGTGTATGNAVYNFSVPWGSGTGYKYTIDKVGIITSASVNAIGNGYDNGDVLTFNNLDLTQAIDYTVGTIAVTEITFSGTVPSSAFVVGNNYTFTSTGPTATSSTVTVREKQLNGANISTITVTIIGTGSVGAGDTSGAYTVASVSAENQYTFNFNDGNGAQRVPSFTILKNNKYNLSIPGGHPFRFSIHPRGKWNSISKSVTLSTSSKTLSIADTTGILLGMTVERDTSVIGETGAYAAGTTVTAVTASSVTLSDFPASAGSATTLFKGAVYTATTISYGSSTVSITPASDTPATLYYYCDSHADMGGGKGYEGVITVSQNNPKTFGSGLELLVSQTNITDVITANVADGALAVSTISGTQINATTGISSPAASITALTSSTSVTTPLLTTSADLTLQSGASSNVVVSGASFNVGSTVSVTSSTGKITTSGEIKTTDKLNINDLLNITNAVVSSLGTSDLTFTPATGRTVKVNSLGAFVIPAGTTSDRPLSPIAQNGSIRYNTTTQQYEGYSSSTSSWSSLGGVRDLDGNTYILAESTVGANDNTLYFYNDGNNTVKFTPTYQDFVTTKKIRSSNTSAPTYTNWTSNTPVTSGQYLKYRNNIYQVVTTGVTGTSGTEPTDTSGNNFSNGTSTLVWYTTAVGLLTLEEISEIRIGPNGSGDAPMVFGGDLRILKNVISTDISDLVIKPLAAKKVDIQATSSLVLPAGTSAQRGVPAQGSVRYSTTLSSFEGYNGTNWTSLGGVKDVDGNTYIIPETSPGANENILYFYNNGSNTLRLSTTELTFDTIDQIGSITNNLDLQAQTVTFNSLALTIDNSGTSTKFLSTKTNFDIALSVGLYTNPLIRLNTTGDIYINKGFGTATDSYIKVLDNELKLFELDDLKIETQETNLTKGTTNSGGFVIFDPTIHTGAKVVICANNITTDNREMYEMTVVAKGTDITHTEYGNVTTGVDIISTLFDFDANSRVRLTATLTSGIANGNVVNITVSSTVFKK